MRYRISLLLVALSLAACNAPPEEDTATTPAEQPQQAGASYYQSIAELQRTLETGETTSVDITRAFLQRIKTLDQNGHAIHAVIEINPEALDIAQARDQARANGQAKGLLFGIPVMVKDNIDTRGPMLTTAGSLALAGAPAPRDATVVEKLREAGAILLGKTNLSEWANIRSSHSTSGWSARGGLTKNPYVLSRNTCGSSSGSGAAVSAGFVTVALGTETDGSIICPSSVNGIVGIKPTLGLVSRAGIVPIAHSQDTAGPMTRSVADAAAVLTVLAGSDPRDPATAEADRHATDYTRFVQLGALQDARIGVVCNLTGYNPEVDNILNDSVAALRAQGAIVIPVTLPHVDDYGEAEFTVLLYELKHDLNAYLASREGLEVKTLADVIAFNRAHAAQEMPWFGQDVFIQAQAKGPLTDKAYLDALEKSKRLAGPEGIDATLAAQQLDALMAPATGPAWVSDLVAGDNFGGAGYSPAAVAGYPSITVPAGNIHGLPVGMVFYAGRWSEPTLIGIAYGFEQVTQARIRPQFLDHAPREAHVPSRAASAGAITPAPQTDTAICTQED